MAPNITEKVLVFKRIRSQLEEIQGQLNAIKAELEAATLEAGGTLRGEDFVLKLVEAQRETVAVKEAKNALGDALAPFIKTSFYSMLRVS